MNLLHLFRAADPYTQALGSFADVPSDFNWWDTDANGYQLQDQTTEL